MTGSWRARRARRTWIGCLDVDLELSALMNALPVRRMELGTGQRAAAPAVYVRARSHDSKRAAGYSSVSLSVASETERMTCRACKSFSCADRH